MLTLMVFHRQLLCACTSSPRARMRGRDLVVNRITNHRRNRPIRLTNGNGVPVYEVDESMMSPFGAVNPPSGVEDREKHLNLSQLKKLMHLLMHGLNALNIYIKYIYIYTFYSIFIYSLNVFVFAIFVDIRSVFFNVKSQVKS